MILFLLILLFETQAQNEIKEIEMGQIYNSFQIKNNNSNIDYYKFKLSDQSRFQDVGIYLESFGTQLPIHIYLSSFDQNPTQEKSELGICQSGYSLCIITQDQLLKSSTYYIYMAFSASDNCGYNFQVNYITNPLSLQLDTLLQVELPQENEMKIKVEINPQIITQQLLIVQITRLNKIIYNNHDLEFYFSIGEQTLDNEIITEQTMFNEKLQLIVPTYYFSNELDQDINLIIRGEFKSLLTIKIYQQKKLHQLSIFESNQQQVRNDETQIYEMKINSLNKLQQNPELDLIIFLRTQDGQCSLFANKQYQPVLLAQYSLNNTQNNYQKVIKLQNSEVISQDNITLYIAVYGNCQYHLETAFQTQDEIIHFIQNKIVEIEKDRTYYFRIDSQQQQFYIFTFEKAEDIQIMKGSQLERNVNFIKIQIFNPSIGHQFLEDQNLMELSSKDFDFEQCKYPSKRYKCQLFITISSTITTFYSLLISKDESQVQLFEDQPLTRAFPSGVHHYYIVVNETVSNPMNIVLQNIGYPVQLQIVASFDHNDINNFEKDKLNYPTNTNILIDDVFSAKSFKKISKQFQGFRQSQVTIYPEDFKKNYCEQQCIVTLSIFTYQNVEYYYETGQQYTIQYSFDSIQLKENLAFFGRTQNELIKYYKAQVTENNTNLMILLTTLEQCDVDIVVKKNKFPTQEDYDWNSREYLGDQLFIESDNPLYPDMEGDYYIGIYGEQNCSYNLIYKTGQFHFFELSQGIPFNLILKDEEIAYFKYYHYGSDQSFNIIVNSNGQLKYYVEEQISQFNQDVFNKPLVKYTFNNNQNGYTESNQFQPSKLDQGYYIYIIAIKAITNVDFFIAIQNNKERLFLVADVLILNQIKENQSQYYSYYGQQQESYLKIKIIKGEILINVDSNKESEYSSLIKPEFYKKMQPSYYKDYDEHIIKITAIKDSIYEIECGEYKDSTIINIGEIYNITLTPQDYKFYHYNSLTQIKKSTFSILVTQKVNYYANREYFSKFKSHQPYVLVIYSANFENTGKRMEPVLEQYRDYSYYAEFEDRQGKYIIEVKNPLNQNVEYDIIFGNNNLYLLPPKIKRYTFLEKDQKMYWQINNQDTGKLIIQMEECGGQTNIYGDESLDQLKAGQYQDRIYLSNYQFAAIDITKSGPYYLTTSLAHLFTNDDILPISITAQLINKNSYVPTQEIQPGSNGRLNYFLHESNGNYFIQVNTAPLYVIEKSTSPLFTIKSIVYYFIIEPFDNDQIYNQLSCANIQKYKNFVQTEVNENAIITFDQQIEESLLLETKEFFIKIQAEAIIQLANQEYIKLQYHYNEYTISNSYLQSLKWKRIMKYSFAIISLLCILLGFYKFLKNKRMQNNLKFEMQEANIEMNYQDLKG